MKKIIIFAILFLTHFSFSTIHYVNVNNNFPIPPYTSWETAATNIQDAVDEVDNSGLPFLRKVIVTNGVYHINEEIRFTNDYIIIESVNGPKATVVVVNSNTISRCFYFDYEAMTVKLDGFTISNGYVNGNLNSWGFANYGGGIYSDAAFLSIKNCIVTCNSADSHDLLPPTQGGGIYCSSDYEIKNCIINGNFADNGSGIFCGDSGSLLNCTIISNRGNSAAVWLNDSSANVENCIIYRNYNIETDLEDNCTNGTYNFCCIYPLQPGISNIVADPLFVNSAAGNYQLLHGSLCIDAGTNQTWMIGDTDIAGNTRIINSRVDIGTYESPVFEYLFLTSMPVTVEHTVTNYAVAGTNTAEIVGEMWVSNAVNGIVYSFNATQSWTTPAIDIIYGENRLFVFGTNVSGSIFYDWIAIFRKDVNPHINITTKNKTLNYGVTNYTIAGINNEAVVGVLNWTNSLGGHNGLLFATTVWEIVDIPIETGMNIITVSGTNKHGTGTFDTVELSYGIEDMPFVDITNTFVEVPYNQHEALIDFTNLNIAGSMGGMYWVNSRHAADTNEILSLPAQVKSALINNLETGDNLTTVFGENEYGFPTNDVINIHRKTLIESEPEIATNALIFPFDDSELYVGFTTNVIWQIDKITDDLDATNLTITKISVHCSETSNEVAIITNDISNLLGKIPWFVPGNLMSGDANYVLKFEVVDSSSLTNSRIFGGNKFTIVPEAGLVISYLFSVFGILIFQSRKLKK